MRNKLSILSQPIQKGGVDTLNLPRNSVHDAYILKFNVTVNNGTSAAITPTAREILEAIAEIKLVTDSTRVHYAMNGHDLALLNALIQKNNTHPFIEQTLDEIAASASKEYSFSLYLDEGDIIAVAHTNVELTVKFADKTAQALDVASAKCYVTLKETIYSTAELQAIYGKNFELVAEPKVYAQTATCNANTEFVGFYDLPTGTLLRKAVLEISGSDFPQQVGILRTVPDRIELNKEDFETHIELDQIIYGTELPVDRENHVATYVMDFGSQWQANGKGKNGWSYAKGDIQLAAKTTAELSVRYISLESMVNTAVYDQAVAFTEY